jgi:photosystem II stability/assembly factor-like uncharacterized protein
MKKPGIVISLILFTVCSYAQWTWQNPLPQGNSLNSVWFTDANTGFAVGMHGTILKTTDGGATWSVHPVITTGYISTVCFTDANHGYAVGEAILRTTDGGNNWTVITNGSNLQLNSVCFPSATTGYAAGGNTIMKTTDAGLTWNLLPTSSSFLAWSIFFTDVNTGYTAGDGGIFKTTDGGLTWTMLLDGMTLTWGLESIWFTNATTGYAVGGGKTILKTVNGGQTWTTVLSGGYLYLYSVFFQDENTGYAVGGDGYVGTIVKTTNAGVTWTDQVSGTSDLFHSVHFTDANTGYVAGETGAILKTSNGGANWTILSSGPKSDLYDINFPDTLTGYAVGDNGMIVKTANAGSNWSALSSGTTELLNSVYFTDAGTGYAAGGHWWSTGIILKTINGGLSWNTLPVGTIKPLNAVHFFDANTGYAVGDSGTIVKTSNGGLTWVTLPGGTTENLYSVYMTNPGTAYVVGGNNSTYIGKILKTVDGGATWTDLSSGTPQPLYSVFFPRPDTGYGVGWFGTIVKTTDGGSTWDLQTSGTNFPLLSVYFSDVNTGYAVGEAGTILRTNNGGSTWIAEESRTDGYLHGVFITPANRSYVAGWSGIILNSNLGAACQAAFTFNLDSINNPSYTVNFTNQSTGSNIAKWIYNFGDGQTQTVTFPSSPDVSHTYVSTGTYPVCLTIINADSTCTDTACTTIVVESTIGCIANFTYSNNLVPFDPVQFVDLSQTGGAGPITSWLWNFGDPQSGANNTSSLQNPAHAFSAPGIYTVCLVIQGPDNACHDSICKTLEIVSQSCQANFIAYPDSLYHQEFHFIDQSSGTIGSWSWNFGDPGSGVNNVSTLQNPVHVYPDGPVIYYVCLTIMSADSTCTDTYCANVMPWAVGCQAIFAHYPDTLINNGVKFLNFSTGYDPRSHWDFGDGTFSNVAEPVHSFPLPGTYHVCLTITDSMSGCAHTLCQDIAVTNTANCDNSFTYTTSNLSVAFTGQMIYSQPATYAWDFGDGMTGTGTPIEHAYAANGTYTVQLLTTTPAGCTFISSQPVTVADSSLLHNLYGQVFAGSFPVVSGNVMIFALDTIPPYSPYTDLVQVDTNGVYYFTFVPDGEYYLFAEPFEPAGYIPTYYGDVLKWEDATLITLGPRANPYDIHLVPADTLVTGPGLINGQITIAAMEFTMIDKIMMLLSNSEGNTIAYYDVSQQGEFQFAFLAFGTYYLKAEIAGVTSEEIMIVLSPEQPIVTVNLLFTGNNIIGVNDEKLSLESLVIYPNPFRETVTVSLATVSPTTLSIELAGSNGQTVYRSEQEMTAGSNLISLPLSHLAAGFYSLHVVTGNGLQCWRKVVKY